MTKWVENLSLAQKILLKSVFMIIGIGLMVVVFYGGSLELLMLTEKKTEWGTLHYIFLGASLLFISLSLALNRIVKIYDLILSSIKGFMVKIGWLK
jgi:hypothetical protein